MTVLLGLTPPIALALWFVMAGRRAEKANALLPRYLLAYQKLCDAPDVDHRVLLAIQVTFESACGFCTGASLLLAKLRPRERSARVAAEIESLSDESIDALNDCLTLLFLYASYSVPVLGRLLRRLIKSEARKRDKEGHPSSVLLTVAHRMDNKISATPAFV